MQLDQAIFLAAFGGGVAAGIVVLGIELIRRYWERPLVKVTVGVGLSMADDPEARDAQLVLEAANVHGQPVTLVSCGLILSTGHRVVLPRSQMSEFPVELGLQRPVVKTVSVEQLLDRLQVWSCVPDDVRSAYFPHRPDECSRRNCLAISSPRFHVAAMAHRRPLAMSRLALERCPNDPPRLLAGAEQTVLLSRGLRSDV